MRELPKTVYVIVLEGPELQSHHEVKRLLDSAMPLDWKVKSVGTTERVTNFDAKGEAI